VTLLVQFRIALQIRETIAQLKNNWKICIKNVYNNIIGHLRSCSDRIGKFSFDSFYPLTLIKSIYLLDTNDSFIAKDSLDNIRVELETGYATFYETSWAAF